MLGSLGPTELLLILVIVMLLFGARKLPQVGAGLGRGIQNFKAAMRGGSDEEID
jgi:sec-independent protein translocase protein TatA